MNESRTVALTLWSRLISGESIDEVDRQRLLDLLQQDSALRKELDVDAKVNALLRFMTDVQRNDDQFIQTVLGQCIDVPTLSMSKVDENATEKKSQNNRKSRRTPTKPSIENLKSWESTV
ncbi:MAG: hypothetical protein R3C03_09510 [Pirellulaceae bacterium]